VFQGPGRKPGASLYTRKRFSLSLECFNPHVASASRALSKETGQSLEVYWWASTNSTREPGSNTLTSSLWSRWRDKLFASKTARRRRQKGRAD